MHVLLQYQSKSYYIIGQEVYYSIGRFYYIIGQLLQYRAFITLSVGTGRPMSMNDSQLRLRKAIVSASDRLLCACVCVRACPRVL